MFEYLADAALASSDSAHSVLRLYRRALLNAVLCKAASNRLEVHRRIAEFWVDRGNAHYASLHLGRAQALRSDGTEAEDNHALDRIEQEVRWLRGESRPALEALKLHAQRMADLGFGYENLLASHRVVTIADSVGDSATASEWWARTEFVAEACGALPLLERWRDERRRLGYGTLTATAETAPSPASAGSTQHPFPEEIPPVNLAEFGIVTRCRSLQDQGGWLARIAPTGLPILIRGESGTGKELFARLVHDLSPRKDRAFLAVNCAALPGEIMESELYGHRRGAFTGAMSDKPGLFMLADSGTLFLDEIGEMAPTLQAKLLRTLESGELRPVGDTRTHRVDVRIVAATNVDLEAAVSKGSFREDLYYRLRGFEISLPPLRDRLEDVEPLARFFLDQANRRLGKSLTLPFETAQWLMGRPWPGNIRELKFSVEQAAGLAGRTSDLVPGHFIASRHAAPTQRSLPEELEAIERSRIQGALRVTDWSVAEAARLLGMSRTTLSGKLKRLGLERPGS